VITGKHGFKTYMEIGHKKLQFDIECNVNKQGIVSIEKIAFNS
jgi:hypothetical protein